MLKTLFQIKPLMLLPVALVLIAGMRESFAAESGATLRRTLLAPHGERLKRVVFTKHFDMGGSHYAYTDAVNDEDTLNPNGMVEAPKAALAQLPADYPLLLKPHEKVHGELFARLTGSSRRRGPQGNLREANGTRGGKR